MALQINRGTPKHPVLRLSGRENVIDVDILDHDGSFVSVRVKRAWDCAGAACIDLVARPRTVRVADDGRAYVKLDIGELAGLRLRNEAYYWLGVS